MASLFVKDLVPVLAAEMHPGQPQAFRMIESDMTPSLENATSSATDKPNGDSQSGLEGAIRHAGRWTHRATCEDVKMRSSRHDTHTANAQIEISRLVNECISFVDVKAREVQASMPISDEDELALEWNAMCAELYLKVKQGFSKQIAGGIRQDLDGSIRTLATLELGFQDVSQRLPGAMQGRCSHYSCTTWAKFNAKGKKRGAYCKKHAEDAMVDVVSRRCSHATCTKIPGFSVEGGGTGTYCKQHAEDGMVDVVSKRCSHDPCKTRPYFDIEGSATAACCKQHAKDGMVNGICKRCIHDLCQTVPAFNFKGVTKAAYCKKHARHDMVHVSNSRCVRKRCTIRSCFNVKGRTEGAYCEKHAQVGMVDVSRKSCSSGPCTRTPSVSSDGRAYCTRHAKGDMVDVRSQRY